MSTINIRTITIIIIPAVFLLIQQQLEAQQPIQAPQPVLDPQAATVQQRASTNKNVLSASVGGNLKANFDFGLGSLLNAFKLPSLLFRRTLTRQQIDNVLYEPNTKCGRVPIFEKQYQRSINETFDPNPDGDFRILHGLDAMVGEWPWIARIKECPKDGCRSCTGSVLNSRWMITAGHCGIEFNKTSLSELQATVGLYDMITPENTSVTVHFDKVIVHPNYNNELDNDLSLLRMKEPLKFNDFIQPLCLINATRNILAFTKNRKCYAVGYGLTDNMMASVKLQKLEISAKPPNDCNSDKLDHIQLRAGTICVGPAKKTGGSCKGDSGGPNQCYDPKTNQWYLIGTVSYGPSNCDRSEESKWLTVSVDVSNYRTWILSTIMANN